MHEMSDGTDLGVLTETITLSANDSLTQPTSEASPLESATSYPRERGEP